MEHQTAQNVEKPTTRSILGMLIFHKFLESGVPMGKGHYWGVCEFRKGRVGLYKEQ